MNPPRKIKNIRIGSCFPVIEQLYSFRFRRPEQKVQNGSSTYVATLRFFLECFQRFIQTERNVTSPNSVPAMDKNTFFPGTGQILVGKASLLEFLRRHHGMDRQLVHFLHFRHLHYCSWLEVRGTGSRGMSFMLRFRTSALFRASCSSSCFIVSPRLIS